MVRSMTGYGRGEAHHEDLTVVVELKSVNNRFCDLQLRCPREYGSLEPRIAAAVKQVVRRGRVDAFVHRTASSARSEVAVDTVLAARYAEALRRVAEAVQAAPGAGDGLQIVVQQPGVLTLRERGVETEEEWPLVEQALGEALEALREMRAAEGLALRDDLGALAAEIERVVVEVRELAGDASARILERLTARLAKLSAESVDPARLAQEAALLADKADIHEELARLGSHLEQFREALSSGEHEGTVGRRLEFLLQEMNREVNTLGAKAAEQEVGRRVVDMKTMLERMREQAANVE